MSGHETSLPLSVQPSNTKFALVGLVGRASAVPVKVRFDVADPPFAANETVNAGVHCATKVISLLPTLSDWFGVTA
ncbi:unannotated protein [freshwater metagenome]|uniref:Unannotated protein n=1 Tax=freshwater metagenome TaxID=449393 RepID=A0A6J6EIX5_9ZZZZ